jgi:(E)-4-hydroxy-3-methyl-but-2-enyl pyrophosphate reductase
MKIEIAKTAGFCMGVRRAVELVLDSPGQHPGPIYTFGPLIHNPQVLGLLEEKGIAILDHVPDSGTGTVLIRAHGVPPQVKQRLKKAGFDVVDATCPRVIRVQAIIRKHAGKGFASIIVGDADHPEVVGLMGYADGLGHVVATLSELQRLPVFEKAIIVAQTTQNQRLFEAIMAWVARRRQHYQVFNTICDSTTKRQLEMRRLAERSEAVVVVGGRSSGNTQRLAEIASRTGKPTFHIEEADELLEQSVGRLNRVAVTAGASTPNWIIRRVVRRLEQLMMKRGRRWREKVYALQRGLLLTNIYVAVGAAGLSIASLQLQGIDSRLPFVFIALLYVLSMHILNNLTGRKSDRYNDPQRAAFYLAYEKPLGLLAVVAGGIGLILALSLGPLPFLLLLVMSITGLSYNLTLLPERFRGAKYRRIKDVPGAKTLLISLAWGVVTAVFPALVQFNHFNHATLVVFCCMTFLVFARTAFFDILDMQGDRIVGKETIPLVLGEKGSYRLLFALLAATVVLLLTASLLGWIAPVGIAIAVCPLFLMIVLNGYRRGVMLPGIRLELLIETQFILAGSISLTAALLK